MERVSMLQKTREADGYQCRACGQPQITSRHLHASLTFSFIQLVFLNRFQNSAQTMLSLPHLGHRTRSPNVGLGPSWLHSLQRNRSPRSARSIPPSPSPSSCMAFLVSFFPNTRQSSQSCAFRTIGANLIFAQEIPYTPSTNRRHKHHSICA